MRLFFLVALLSILVSLVDWSFYFKDHKTNFSFLGPRPLVTRPLVTRPLVAGPTVTWSEMEKEIRNDERNRISLPQN